MTMFGLLTLMCFAHGHAASFDMAQAAAVRAAQARYKIVVLRHSDGDLVVLAGETHIKMRRAHDLGETLLNNFGTRGLEAEDGARGSAAMRMQNKMTLPFLGALNALTGRRGPYWSTLLAALDRAPTEGHGPIQIVPLEALAEGERMHPMTALAYVQAAAAEVAVPFALLNRGKLGLWARRYTSLTGVFFVAGMAAYFFARPYERATVAEKGLFSFYYGILERRNDLMVRNIVRSKPERGSAPLLVIVGRAHVPGMSQLLRDDHGYERVDLDDLASMTGMP